MLLQVSGSGALKIPGSYCYSPSLVTRPADWPLHINAVGFCRDPDSAAGRGYQPSPELEAFLSGGDPPLYIGFGSMVPGTRRCEALLAQPDIQYVEQHTE